MTILYTPNPSVAYWITLAVTVLLPLIVGVVTKASTNPAVKSVLLLALAAATSVGYNLLAVRGVTDVGPMITDTVATFVIAVATYFGVWRTNPVGVLAAVQNVGVRSTP